uniref:Uncharacterized protein n=1 Tax=Anguilla anguilla TaxID=7936 RepID=A0A0E9RFX7_ANGAN
MDIPFIRLARFALDCTNSTLLAIEQMHYEFKNTRTEVFKYSTSCFRKSVRSLQPIC